MFLHVCFGADIRTGLDKQGVFERACEGERRREQEKVGGRCCHLRKRRMGGRVPDCSPVTRIVWPDEEESWSQSQPWRSPPSVLSHWLGATLGKCGLEHGGGSRRQHLGRQLIMLPTHSRRSDWHTGWGKRRFIGVSMGAYSCIIIY